MHYNSVWGRDSLQRGCQTDGSTTKLDYMMLTDILTCYMVWYHQRLAWSVELSTHSCKISHIYMSPSPYHVLPGAHPIQRQPFDRLISPRPPTLGTPLPAPPPSQNPNAHLSHRSLQAADSKTLICKYRGNFRY